MRSFLRGSIGAVGGKGVAIVSSLGINAMLARLLEPHELGAFFLIQSVASGGAILALLGIRNIVVRVVAESMGRDMGARARAAVWKGIALVSVGIVVVSSLWLFGVGHWVAISGFNSPTMDASMLATVCLLAMLAMQFIVSESFRGFHHIGMAQSFGGVISNVIILAVFLGVWLMNESLTASGAIWLFTLGLGVNVSVGLYFIHRIADGLSGGEPVGVGRLLREAWPLWVANVVFFVLQQADLWIAGVFFSEADVALYGAAVRIAWMMALPLTVINLVVPPLIAELHQREPQELERMLRATAGVASLGAGILLVAFVFFGREFLGVIFGPFYADSAPILAVLAVGGMVSTLVGSCSMVLVMTGRQVSMMYATLAGCIVVVVGGWWAAPRHGPLGLAIAAGLGMAFQNVLMFILAKRQSGLWTHFGGVGDLFTELKTILSQRRRL